MGIQHIASKLILKNVPVVLDTGVHSILTFNNGLYGRVNQLQPITPGGTDRERQLEVDIMSDTITVHGKHGNGVLIQDGVPVYLRYSLPSTVKTISFWFKSNSNEEIDFGTPRVLMGQTTAGGVDTTTDPYWLCYITKTTEVIKNIVCLKLATPTVSYYCVVNKNVLDGEWHHVTIEFNVTSTAAFNISNTVSRLWVDGEYAETAIEAQIDASGASLAGPFTGYETPFSFYNESNPFFFRVGHQDGSGESSALSNCIYDDIVVYTSEYDKDTVLSWYISNSEPYMPVDYSAELQEDYIREPLGAWTYDDMANMTYLQLFKYTHNRLEGNA